MKFHEILGQVLFQHGIKASSLSNLIGLTPNALDLTFKRQSEPNWETIRRICHELNISPDVFHDLGDPVELPPLPVSRRPNGPAPGDLTRENPKLSEQKSPQYTTDSTIPESSSCRNIQQ